MTELIADESGQSPQDVGYYRLNCDTVTTINPGQEVAYAMQVPVPAVSGGMAKFSFQIPRASLYDGGILTIT